VARVLAEAARLEEVSTKILQAVCESLEWDVGEIWVFDEQVNVLRCEKAWHVPSLNVSEFEAITKEITFKPGVGLPGRVWTNAKPAWIADVVQDESFLRAPYAAKDEIHGAFAFPIMSGSERLGVMTFFSHDIQEPDETLLEMMGAIGSQIGQFMKRKRAEEEIHYLKEYLETILGSLDVYVRVVNPKLGVEYENPQLKKKFGDGVGKPCYLIWQCNLPCENCTSERAIQTNRVQRKEETLPGGQSYSVTSVPLQTREGTPAAIEIIYDITRLKQNEYEIRSLASRILSAQENERKRISRELHDETGQALTAINLNLIMIEKNFTKDVQNTKKTLSSSKKMLSQIMKDIKQLSYDLRPAMLDDFGLVPAMQSYAREFTERTGISITVKSELVELRFPQEVEISLYRILQEALTNVVKHSKAKNVVIELYIENNKLIMKVEDDGRGFDTDNVLKKVKITNSSTPVSSRHKKENRLA
jgi:signal transduction histidine kinase